MIAIEKVLKQRRIKAFQLDAIGRELSIALLDGPDAFWSTAGNSSRAWRHKALPRGKGSIE